MAKVAWVSKGAECYHVGRSIYKIHLELSIYGLGCCATVFYSDGARVDMFNPDLIAYEADDEFKQVAIDG